MVARASPSPPREGHVAQLAPEAAADLLDHGPDAVLVVDEENERILATNATAEALFGTPRQHLIGRTLEDLRNGPSPPMTPVPSTSQKHQDMTWLAQDSFRTADGSVRPMLVHWKRVPTKGALVASLRDARAALRFMDARARLADEILMIVRTLPDVIFSCEKRADGKIYWTLNEGRLAEEFHVTTEEIRGKPLDELFPGGTSEHIRKEFEDAFAGREKEWVNEMGGRFFKHYPQPVRASDGAIEKVVGFITEVTSMKLAEEKLARMAEELERRVAELDDANRQLESFSYSVSHDLRTPLSVIDTLAQVLKLKYASQLDDDGRAHLDRLRHAALKMNRLIEDILQLSRASRFEMNRQRLDLSQMVRDAVAQHSHREPDRAVDTNVQAGLVVDADPRYLTVVIDNLIGNAWKYTGQAKGPRIEFGRAEHHGRTAYYVRDNGIGFTPEQSRQVFAAFTRLPEAQAFEGTGIGLATVRRIIERHGGRIWADARPGHGATFWFTLGEDDA